MAAATITVPDIIDNSDSDVQRQKEMKGKMELLGCNCLASCNSVSYEANVREVKLAEPIENEIEHSKLIVQFNEQEFLGLKRTELYGFVDFIASCGGLLGLFMGVSLLSFVELIYFFTVRSFSSRLSSNDNE